MSEVCTYFWNKLPKKILLFCIILQPVLHYLWANANLEASKNLYMISFSLALESGSKWSRIFNIPPTIAPDPGGGGVCKFNPPFNLKLKVSSHETL